MARWTILTVCTANICRSPMMELLLRDRLDESVFEVASAGVQGWRSSPIDSMVRVELARLGIDSTTFRSRAIRPEHITFSDLVLTATKEHRAAVLDLDPAGLRKTFTLREFAALVDGCSGGSLPELVSDAARRRSTAPPKSDVPDPFRRSPQVHREVADLIDGATQSLADVLATLDPPH